MNQQEQEDRIAIRRAKADRRDLLKSRVKLLGGGFVAGVVLTLILGFSTGNFITPSNAERMTRDAANDAQTAALVPYCVASFNESPEVKKNLAALLETSEWMRDQFIRDGKWAGDGASSQINGACATKLVTEAKAVSAKES
ncbi:MAG: hypothetical protein GEU87_15015 [Alphaproteobacteria bacterium]|nr:hypothetical protein [Alphaproteobacteria bacterium]